MNQVVAIALLVGVSVMAATMEGDEAQWLPGFDNVIIDGSASAAEQPCFFSTFPEEILDTRSPDTKPAESYCTIPVIVDSSSSATVDPMSSSEHFVDPIVPTESSSEVQPPIDPVSSSEHFVDPTIESSSEVQPPIDPVSSSEHFVDPIIESSSSTNNPVNPAESSPATPEPHPQPVPQPVSSEQAAASKLGASCVAVILAALVALH